MLGLTRCFVKLARLPLLSRYFVRFFYLIYQRVTMSHDRLTITGFASLRNRPATRTCDWHLPLNPATRTYNRT